MLKIYFEAKNCLHTLNAYLQDSKGATAFDFALVACGIALATLAAVLAIEPHLVADYG